MPDERRTPNRPFIIAYGGVDIHALAQADLKDSWTREPLALSYALLLRLLVPAYHLLHLTGPFPVIHGNDDKRIPKKPTDGLHL